VDGGGEEFLGVVLGGGGDGLYALDVVVFEGALDLFEGGVVEHVMNVLKKSLNLGYLLFEL
jgi:hypothetical protein